MSKRLEIRQQYEGSYAPIVHHDGELRVNYRTQTGRFNMLSNDESTICRVYVLENGKKLASTSIDVSDVYETEDNDIDTLLWLFEEDSKMHWIDTAKERKLAVRDFIVSHRDAIEIGNASHEITMLTREIASKSERLEYLANFVLESTS